MVIDRRTGRAVAGIAVLAYVLSFLGWLFSVLLRPEPARIRAAGVAAVTFVATVLLGWVALPVASKDFWSGTRSLGLKISAHVSVADATNQALRPMLLRALGPGTAATAAWLFLGAP